MTGNCSEGTFTQFSAVQWECRQLVEFHTGVQSLVGPLSSAVSAWQSRLASTGLEGLPTFTYTASSSLAEATATGTGLGTSFCGSWTQATKTLQVIEATGCSTGQSTGALASLLRHEVGHAVGWIGGNTHRGLPSHCIMYLPDDRSINSNICTHEVEGILAGYGLVAYPAEEFFSTPFVVGSASGMVPRTLQVGDTLTLTPGGYLLELGGEVPNTESAYSWSSSNTSVATVVQGHVRAVGAGTTSVYTVPLQGSGYFLAHPFRSAGASTTITVAAPPPQPPEIRLDQVPVWDEGYHTFTYVGPGTPGSLTWYIDDSRTIGIEPDTTITTTGWTLTIYITAGSYNLRVSAAGITHDFPVCTRNGGANLLDDEGPVGTDAVAGCPAPELD